jgi:predicted HicB family RNase H-like nuclease
MDNQIHFRLPPALHEQLKAKAVEQGMSMQALLLALVSAGIGFTLDPEKDGS